MFGGICLGRDLTIALCTTILGVLLTLLASYAIEKVFGTKEFKDRKLAKNKMMKDMIKSTDLYYVGITHEKMVDYFKETMRLNEDNKLDWKKIHFFFPDSEYGNCWDKDYDKKMNLSILQISNYLLNEAIGYLPKLEHVYFYLNPCGINFGGSLYKYKKRKHPFKKSKDPYNIIYDVQQVKRNDKEQENAKTIRLNHSYPSHKVFFERITESFEEMKSEAQMLYCINCKEINLWNLSTASWDKFEQNYTPYAESMQHLLNQINLQAASNILSLGVGTGNLENMLLSNKGYQGFLGLVDNSYSMLNYANNQLKGYENISYALIDLSKKWTLYGALANRKYDFILIHFSIHLFISSHQTVSDFARKLKRLLDYNGKIVIAIHDGIYAQPDEKEPLRKLIREFAERNNIPVKSAKRNIPLEELKTGFFNNGLFVIEESEKLITRTIEERIAMWEVDAILDSILDVQKISSTQKNQLLKEMNKIKSLKSKPMAVKYLQFSEITIVTSAIILNEKGQVLTVVKKGAYLLPGGVMLLNELEENTLKRELMEKLSIKPENLTILNKVGKFAYEKGLLENKPLLMNVYKCELSQTALNSLKADNDMSTYEWIDLNKYNTYENMPKQIFTKIFKKAGIVLN